MKQSEKSSPTGKHKSQTLEDDFKMHYRNIRLAILHGAGKDIVTYRRDIWIAAFNRIQSPPFNYSLSDLARLQDEVDAQIERDIFGTEIFEREQS